MTDSAGRRNPAPRPALPRRTRTEPPGRVAPPPAAPVTGRDVIIPSVAASAAPAAEPPAAHPAKRTGQGRAAAVPSLADLMPPARPRTKDEPPAEPTPVEPMQPQARAVAPVPRPVTPPTPVPRPQKHGKGTRRKAEREKGREKDREKTVDLVVPLSKGLRKRLRGKAAEHGMEPEQAVAQLVRIWVDG